MEMQTRDVRGTPMRWHERGAADQFQKVGHGYRLAHDLGTHLERIEGGKHFVPEDHPGRVAAIINGLLARLEARAPLPDAVAAYDA